MTKVLTSKEVVAKLRDEASKNPTFNAVCHIFAMRERSRNRVTLNSLMATMKREGFVKFDKASYEGVLKLLADLNLGKLDYDIRGRLRSVKGIKVTLQSIGMSAVSKQDSLATVSEKDQPLKQPQLPKIPPFPSPFPNTPPAPKASSKQVVVKIEFEGTVLTFQCPDGVQPRDVLALLAGLYTKRVRPADASV